jgi:hypothetical protein
MYINVNYSFRITLLEVIIEISLKLYVSVLQIRDIYPGSRMFIPDPGSKNSSKREGCKKFVVIPFYVATNSSK